MTRVKGARISNEIADFYDDYDMRAVLESLYREIQDGKIEVKDGEICVNNSVNTPNIEENGLNKGNVESENPQGCVNNTVNTLSDDAITSLNDIEEMVVCSGGTLEKFLTDLDIKLTWETLKLKNGEIDVSALGLSEELDNLKNACEEKGVPMDEAIRKTAQRIWGIRQ